MPGTLFAVPEHVEALPVQDSPPGQGKLSAVPSQDARISHLMAISAVPVHD
eukprot:COSAG04_NODE_24111_length_327_cov_0.679825_1_plen_50_part_10